MTETPSERIRRWMETTTMDGGLERLDHLHIDAIDPRWKHRSTWVHSALSMYRLALEIRDKLRIPFKIALVFSLRSGTSDTFSSVSLFERELDWSPPSLYLLPRQHSFYDGASIQLDPLPNGIARTLPPGTESRLLIWAETDGEQRRALLIEG